MASRGIYCILYVEDIWLSGRCLAAEPRISRAMVQPLQMHCRIGRCMKNPRYVVIDS